jgi:rubrerythrin
MTSDGDLVEMTRNQEKNKEIEPENQEQQGERKQKKLLARWRSEPVCPRCRSPLISETVTQCPVCDSMVAVKVREIPATKEYLVLS